ncbi:dirigent protein 9-like [Diospyros lotus]|uniref:dirigent protein 9-like n=1 Tax=Diospyros lotus TaxID=55363 RepID=UPI00224C8022|nr:dirigent protein 9-like [Diospyros lotus]
MAKTNILKVTIFLLLQLITTGSTSSARILDEVEDPQPPITADSPAVGFVDDPKADDVPPVAGTAATLPNGQIPATATATGTGTNTPGVGAAPLAVPSTSTGLPNGVAPVIAPSVTEAPDAADAAPVVATPIATSPSGASSISATVAEHPQLSFFMHDILGGTHPSGRVVTGIVANSDDNNLPFSKPNNQVFPISGGVPLNTFTGVVNDNNAPSLVGLNGSPGSTVIQNSGNNNIVNGGNNLPFVTAGQLPAGLTLQQLMFGSITVVDNELTQGHELGSAVLGKMQGFYLSSSLDGTSHTLVLTALLHGGEHDVDDTISFFGIHRTGSPVSQIALIGGTGKYENAKGYATIETLPQQDQHTTDGVETITEFSVYLTL